jgi:putative oxidoreductase
MQGVVFALGRALLSPLFIVSGVMKFMNVAGILGNPGMKNFMALVGGGAPPVWLGYLIAFIEVAGGLMILFGIKAKAAAIVLFLFVVATILFRHRFWIDPAEQTQALKNFAIMGALLMIAVSGAGAYSVDNRTAR